MLAAALKAQGSVRLSRHARGRGREGVGDGIASVPRCSSSRKSCAIDFRNWRAAPDSIKPWIEARIIDDAGVLGHYVADGSNPAHTTIQYNGWTGANPNGYATDKQFHARFESAYVGANIKLADVTSRMDTVARVLPDFRAAIIEYLRQSNAQVEPLYKIDKAHPFDADTTAPENKAFAADRLAAGARMLRDIWWTAWVTSG